MANKHFEQALKLTQEIEKEANELIALEDSIEQTKSEMAVWKAQITQAISDELNAETGKSKFSNDTSRNAELALRCENDSVIKAQKQTFALYSKHRVQRVNKIEKYKNQLSIYKAFATVLEVS